MNMRPVNFYYMIHNINPFCTFKACLKLSAIYLFLCFKKLDIRFAIILIDKTYRIKISLAYSNFFIILLNEVFEYFDIFYF